VLLIQTIDRQEARKSPLLPELQAAGFTAGASGLSWRRGPAPLDEADLLEDA
jgi:hypothetical protein